MSEKKLILGSELKIQSLAEELFNDLNENLIGENDYEHESQFNYCNSCNIPMNHSGCGDGYKCPNCGYIRKIIGNIKDCDDLSCNVKSSNRKYSVQQQETIRNELFDLNEKSSFKIPKDILSRVAEKYHSIQNHVIEEEEDGVMKEKKFVRRGQVKNRVLAAILANECMKSGVARRNSDIAEFMALDNNGFSKGENILKSLSRKGIIELCEEHDQTESFIRRYFSALSVESENYVGFVYDLIQLSIKKKIGMSSVACSKVAGGIWFLITHQSKVDKDLDISKEQLEIACDNIRSNTFTNFSKELEANKGWFLGLFLKYEIYPGDGVMIWKKTRVKKELTAKSNAIGDSI